MFEGGDGTQRAPRAIQVEYLNFVETNLNKVDVIAGSLPCGSGKTFIAKAIMDEFPGSVLITANNALVKQMKDDYKGLNTLIGKKHYRCSKNPEFSCEDMWKLKNHKPCGKCAYYTARNRYLEGGESTVFNAISYFYCMKDPKWSPPKVLIVDEADKLLEMLMLISGEVFDKKFQPPKEIDFISIADWLKEKEDLISKFVTKADTSDAMKALIDLTKVQRVREGITTSPSAYVHGYDDKGNLIVFPIEPPRELIDKLLQCEKLILMSATLYKSDIPKLTSKTVAYIEMESPIPVQNRQIIVKESPVQFNWKTPPEAIAEWVKEVMALHPNMNTIVHVTYSLSKKLKKYFKGAYVNDKENKGEVLEKFKKGGGLWLAAGCSEGLSLDYSLCELNLVPVLPTPNTEDQVQKRRLALPSGTRDYDIRVLKTVQQQAGRSTRAEDDKSFVYVGDRRFKRLVLKYRDELPKTFLDAIVWR